MSFSTLGGGSNGAAVPAAVAPNNLAVRLSDPKVAESLAAILDRLDLVVLLVDSLNGLLSNSETILNSVLDSAIDARATLEGTGAMGMSFLAEMDLTSAVEAGKRLATALPGVSPALLRGIESGAIDALTSPGLVQLLRLLSESTQAALEDKTPVELNGALSVARALKDPDVARAAAFVLTLTRAIGRHLAAGESAGSSPNQA